MAVIQNLKEIENLIPERDYTFFSTPVKSVYDTLILNNPLYAIVLNKQGRVTNIYKMIFFIQRLSGGEFKLFITNSCKDFKSASDYVVAKNDKTPWPFKNDNVGLYLQSESKTGNKIYFGTKINDIHTVRELLGDKTPVYQTVYASEVII